MSLFRLLVLVSFTFTSNANAIDNQSNRCARYLGSVRPFHQIPSLSNRETKESLDYLRRFKGRLLPDQSNEPGNEAVSATQNSLRSKKQKVSRRLAGILNENTGKLKSHENELLAATTIRGKKDIERFLKDRLELRNQIYRLEDQTMINLEIFLSFFGMPIITTAVVYTGLTFIETPNLIIFFLTWINREIPETSLRHFTFYSLSRPIDLLFQKKLKNIERSQWNYHSFDIKTDREAAQKIWKLGFQYQADLSINRFRSKNYGVYGFPYLTRRFTGKALNSFERDPPDFTHFRVDELLSYDWQTGEPVLTIVIRMTEKKPPYPRKVKVKKKDKVKSSLGELIPVRTGN